MNNLLTHLENRKLNLDLYSHYLSDDGDCVTFPLWNLSGQMIGIQQYRPNKPKVDSSLNPRELRYYTLFTKTCQSNKDRNMLGAFGLEQLDHKQKFVFVCEGIFDACRLHNKGLNALALFSCYPKPLMSWLWSMGYIIVPVCEGDEAGHQLSNLANSDLVIFLPEGKDLGELTDEEIDETFHQFL